MKKFLKIIIFLLYFFPFSLFGQQTVYDSIIHDNVYRNYIVYVPATYNPSQSTPLVFNLHGRTSNAYEQMLYGDFRTIADTANFIIVHPQGLLDNTGVTHWNIGQSTVDDIGFFNSLYTRLIYDYNIDLSRVYSTGMSNGGYMSYYLACLMNDKISAVASVTGAMSQYTQIICNPTHPTPIMEIHGTADLTVPFNDIISGLDYWINYNNCNFIADTTVIPDLVLGDWSTVEHIVYNNGDNGSTTELFKVNNGGHTWPGSNFSIGVTNYDINASIEIWKFFSRYNLNNLATNISENNNSCIDNKRVNVITDVLGREIEEKSNILLFYIYSDGTIEKKIILD